jgi:hypothetical protein
MNAQDGEIFRAIYRKGKASHSDELRDARKVLFYAQAEVKRLEQVAADTEPAKERAVQDYAEALKKIQEELQAHRGDSNPLRYSAERERVNAAIDAMQPIGPGTVGWQGVK